MKGFLGVRRGRTIGEIPFDGKIIIDMSHDVAIKIGFKPDKKNNVYILEGFGALKCNIDASIKTIVDLKNYKDKTLKINPYLDVLPLIEQGYEFVIGPAFPDVNGRVCDSSVGLYCKNYLEIMEKEKQTENSVNV